MRLNSSLAWFLFLTLSLAACQPTPVPLPATATETMTPSETPTPTIVWFPPTSTYTPLPSPPLSLDFTPEPDLQFGQLILEDQFDQPELWTQGTMPAGSIAFGINELSLGVSQPEGYLYSLRDDMVIGDAFLEITASPSICRGKDEYGVLFRVSPGLDFFRFGLNCDAEARLDRVISGQASTLQAPKLSGAVPPGAPSTSRIGIWFGGKEMRFYVNGTYLYTIQDDSLPSGAIGVYARSASQDAMTVNFSDLEIYNTQP